MLSGGCVCVFFKQKTAYEMRISDWSSDVCSSDLGEQPSRTVRLQAYDMLVATNRQTSGEGYRLMADALTRLRGTTVRTNIQTGGVEETRIFGLIEEAKITRKTFDGRMLDLEITLSDWVYRSV